MASIQRFFLLVFILLTVLNKVQAQKKVSDLESVKATIFKFIQGIDELDVDKVSSTYSKNATVFYPFSFTPKLLKGRDVIANKQTEGFELMKKIYDQQGKPLPETLDLKPTDFEIQMLTKEVAVVNWHSPRPNHIGRRTAVVQKLNGQWLIVSHHASNTSIR